MNALDSLIDPFEPLAPMTPCGAVVDRFLDASSCDLLPVVDAGRVIGVVARGAVRSEDIARPVREIMTSAFSINADMTVDEARALLLGHRDPMVGLVVVEDGAYRGVVSARALMRAPVMDTAMKANQLGFLELISREMRTPLNGVLAVSELLQRQPLSVDAQAHVRTIVESAQATSRALNDALELSQIDIEALSLEPVAVQLRELMDAVQGNWQARADQCGVTLLVGYDGAPDLAAVIDDTRVQQVFDKLIEAALGLNRRGAVEASLQAVHTAGGLELTGRVRDTGGGLSIRRLAGVFDEAPLAVGAGLASAGLGLTLCRRVVERMGGSIRLESNVGEGATVVFKLKAPEAAQASPDAVGEAGVGRTAHVLVVDDNATNRMVAEALCDMFDCTSECAEDGLEAVEAARTGRFDLILMDIRMPRMDGVEATRAIRALPGAAGRVPIIALTANADPEDAKTYLANGMHSVVEKPIKPDRLLQAMSDALPQAEEEEDDAASAAA